VSAAAASFDLASCPRIDFDGVNSVHDLSTVRHRYHNFLEMTAPLKPLSALPVTPTTGPQNYMTGAVKRLYLRLLLLSYLLIWLSPWHAALAS
jgi:hypothetical protein